jgi:NH3-dependent NAD+ synthetase
MSDHKESEIEKAKKVFEYFEHPFREMSLASVQGGMYDIILGIDLSDHDSDTVINQTLINIMPRLRMTLLYALAQRFHGRVINTTNLSEKLLGYNTK